MEMIKMIDISRTSVPGDLVSTSQLLPYSILSAHEVWILFFPCFTDEGTMHSEVK